MSTWPPRKHGSSWPLSKGWLANEATVRFHRTLSRDGWPDVVFAFHDDVEIGPKMLGKIAKRTGLTPNDL